MKNKKNSLKNIHIVLGRLDQKGNIQYYSVTRVQSEYRPSKKSARPVSSEEGSD